MALSYSKVLGFILIFLNGLLSQKVTNAVASAAEQDVIAKIDNSKNTITYNGVEYLPITEHGLGPVSSTEFMIDLLIIAFLTLMAGAMSGLTVGYLSIDDLVLELKLSTGTEQEKHYANRILPIINQHHWLLVTLLLCNSIAMEALPIVLDRIVSEVMAIAISVTLVLFVGEIIPQALCTGPNQLKIASALAPLTYFLMYLTYPISYPLALFIDLVVGKHLKSRFANSDLKGLIELHTIDAIKKINNAPDEIAEDMGLLKEQAQMMIGALEIKEKKVKEIMIPIKNVTMIDYESELDQYTIENKLKGFSRIPVYIKNPKNVIGILRTKQLIGKDLSKLKKLEELNVKLSAPLVIHPDTMAIDLIDDFSKGRSHMAFITENVEKLQKSFGLDNENSLRDVPFLLMENKKVDYPNLLGIVTLEDVIEKMFKVEIMDEDDYNRKKQVLNRRLSSRPEVKHALTRRLTNSFITNQRGNLVNIIGHSYKKGFDIISPDNNYSLIKDERDHLI